LSLKIQDELKKYCLTSQDGTCVDKFVCPVEGCGFTTRLGPGALRMHLLLKSDPKFQSRYCPTHEQFYITHVNEMGLEAIRYLGSLPRVQLI
jgi:hypothetical protein